MPQSSTGGRGAGRPRDAVLSRERILDAAYALAQDPGTDFTLAALARRLDVRPSAIHHYFPGKDALITEMRGHLTRRLGRHGFDEIPWYEAIMPWARAYRDALGSHPGIIAALATLPVAAEPESIADYERIVGAFARAGFPEHRIVPALVAIESFIIGSSLDALAPHDNLRPDGDAAPALERAERRSREDAAARGTDVATSAFEFGLAALVAGLREAGRR